MASAIKARNDQRQLQALRAGVQRSIRTPVCGADRRSRTCPCGVTCKAPELNDEAVVEAEPFLQFRAFLERGVLADHIVDRIAYIANSEKAISATVIMTMTD